MKIDEKIRNIKEKVEPYHSLIFMVIGFLTLFVAGYKIIINPPDLSIKIKKDLIDYPSSINLKMIELNNFLLDSLKNKKMKQNLSEVYGYMIKTKHHWEVEITNETENYIRDVSLRINNVGDLTSYGVVSQTLLEEETNKILRSLYYEESSGIVFLKEFASLPPKSSIKLILWGEFNDYSLEEPVIVSYDGGVGKYEKTITIDGFKAYLAEYLYQILLLLFFVFIFVFRYAVKK